MHLLVEQPETLEALMESMVAARAAVRRCESCGNLAESAECAVCEDERRNPSSLCVVEHVPDLIAIERSSAWKGKYHVLHGKLSPIHGIGPEDLNFQSLIERIEAGGI